MKVTFEWLGSNGCIFILKFRACFCKLEKTMAFFRSKFRHHSYERMKILKSLQFSFKSENKTFWNQTTFIICCRLDWFSIVSKVPFFELIFSVYIVMVIFSSFVDRASWHIRIIWTNKKHHFLLIYFSNKPLNVSSRFAVRHQEDQLCIISNWYSHALCWLYQLLFIHSWCSW